MSAGVLNLISGCVIWPIFCASVMPATICAMRASMPGSCLTALVMCGQSVSGLAVGAATATAVTTAPPSASVAASTARRRMWLLVFIRVLVSVVDSVLCVAQEGAVPLATLLEDAALRRVVDVGQAEAAQIAFRPFEVVQQAPGEIALDVAAGGDGVAHGGQVADQVIAPRRVVSGADSLPPIRSCPAGSRRNSP